MSLCCQGNRVSRKAAACDRRERLFFFFLLRSEGVKLQVGEAPKPRSRSGRASVAHRSSPSSSRLRSALHSTGKKKGGRRTRNSNSDEHDSSNPVILHLLPSSEAGKERKKRKKEASLAMRNDVPSSELAADTLGDSVNKGLVQERSVKQRLHPSTLQAGAWLRRQLEPGLIRLLEGNPLHRRVRSGLDLARLPRQDSEWSYLWHPNPLSSR